MDWEKLQQHLISGFRLGSFSAHDHDHWRRVESYGVYLAPLAGADLEVVRLFAWLHDSQRESDGHDPYHGERAESVARSLCGNYFQLEPDWNFWPWPAETMRRAGPRLILPWECVGIRTGSISIAWVKHPTPLY